MPTVLALYPGSVSFRQELARRQRSFRRARGVRLVLADDYILESDRELFDETIELPPAECVGEAWSILERYWRARPVDAVLAQSEGGLLLGALACDALGLPGITPRAALLCTSKFLCRRELDSARLSQPRFTLARDADTVRAFAQRSDVGYPVVLKGVASALGRLVSLVRDASDVEPAVERLLRGLTTSTDIRRLSEFAALTGFELGCDPRREFLVESFAAGDPVETDGLVVGTQTRSFGVTQQVLSAPPRFFLEGYQLPADRPAHEIAAIEALSDAALAALGVSNTGYSIEMRIRDGRASLIEVNGRLGWDEGFGDMFAASTGRQPELEALHLALGSSPPVVDVRRRATALAYSTCYEDRVVERVPSPAEIDALTRDGLTIGLAVYPGCRMYAPPHPETTPHLAFALATHPDSSRTAYAHARAAVDRLEFGLAPAETLPVQVAFDAGQRNGSGTIGAGARGGSPALGD